MPEAKLDPQARAALRAALDEVARTAGRDRTSPERTPAHPDEAEIALYLSRELAPEAIERLERHLAICPSCSEEVVLAARIERAAAGSGAGALPAMVAAPGATAAHTTLAAPASATPIPAAPASDRSHPSGDARSARRAAGERPRAGRPPRARRSRWRRLSIAAGLVLLVAAGGLAVGGQLALDRLQPLLIDRLAGALGRDVSAERLSFALAGGPGLRVQGLRIADDPRYSKASLVDVGEARLHLAPAELLRGRAYGSIELDDAVLRLVRGPGGLWNVQTLGGEGPAGARSARAATPRAAAAEEASAGRVRLTATNIRNGQIEISDRSSAAPARQLVLRDVALDVQSQDPARPATLHLDGKVGGAGERSSIAISGEIGPFTGGASPRYQLTDVDLEGVPVRDIPGSPASLSGQLAFRGRLESSGDDVATVVANATGDGDLRVSAGALGDGNLGRMLVASLQRALTSGGAGASGAGGADAAQFADRLLAAASRDSAVGAALAAPETAFNDLGGTVDLASSGLRFRDLALATSLFDARASGSLERNGTLAVSGTVELTPQLAALVAQAAPAVRPLLDAQGGLDVPFQANGTWPSLRLQVDMTHALARAFPLDPRRLELPFAGALLGSTFSLDRVGALPFA